MNRRMLCAGLLAGLAIGAWADVFVQVRKGQLRATPSYLGAITATVSYGDALQVLESQGEWRKARSASGAVGWINQSAVTKRAVAMNAGSGDAAIKASNDEVALAGKGFNAQVEEQYRKDNAKLDFASIDRMETFGVEPQQLAAFLKAGLVTPAQGGRP